jgi:hypothetical protein
MTVPLWVCLCGARNRLRDLTCRNCGAAKPYADDDEER